MTFNLFGISFEIDPLFFPVLTIMLLIDKSGVALPVVAAMLIHESGHIIAMLIFKKRIRKIQMMPSAVLIKGEASFSFLEDIIVSFGGIAFNALSMLLLYFIQFKYSINCLLYIAANLLLGALNILPLKGLDGGKILLTVLYRICDNAEVIFKYISIAVSFIISFIFLYFIFNGFFNITAIFFVIYIFAVLLIKV